MEAALERFLPAPDIVPERLHRAMRYCVLGGGKRVRPLLAFASGELAGADPARVEVVAAAVRPEVDRRPIRNGRQFLG